MSSKPEMKPFSFAIRNAARRIAKNLSLVIGGAGIVLTLGVLGYVSNLRSDLAIRTVTSSIHDHLRLGDIYAIRSQLLTLSFSGGIDEFWLGLSDGIELSGTSGTETPANLSHLGMLFKKNDLPKIFFQKFKPNLSQSYKFDLGNGRQAHLVTSKSIPLMVLGFSVIFVFLLNILLNRVLNRHLRFLANEAISPIERFSIALKSASSVNLDQQFGDRTFEYKEIAEAYQQFLSLMNRLNEETQARLVAEKESLLSHVASQVSHDIRSPLAALKYLLFSLRIEDPEIKEMLSTSIDRIHRIADDLLQTRRAYFAGERTTNETVLLSGIAKNLCEEKKLLWGAMGLPLDFEFRISDRCAVSLETPGAVERMFSNLLNNSYEALPSIGLRKINFEIDVSENRWVYCSVSDSGSGISASLIDKIEKLQDPWGPIQDFTKKTNNFGLGMNQIRKTLVARGGRIKVDSRVGFGTKIEIFFKLNPNVNSGKAFDSSAGIIENQNLKPESLH